MNDAEIELWNGVVGDRWVLYQETLDARLLGFGEDALAGAELAPGMRVLDVGCGCGDTTLSAASRVGPDGLVTGVDVSRPMLARAKQRSASVANVTFVEADASTYTPDVPVDAVLSRFGVMFFENPGAAFANLRTATKPGGRLSFVCWRALDVNPWAAVPLSAVLRVLPPPPPAPPNASGPFAFADERRVRGILEGAGYRDVVIEPRTHPFVLGSSVEDAVEMASRMGPAARALRDADDEARPRALEMLRQTLAPLAPSFTLDGNVWRVTARA